MSSLHKKHKETGIIVIGIHTPGSKIEDIQKVMEKYKLGYPICIDTAESPSGKGFGAISSAYGVNAIPYAFVIDQEGNIAGHGWGVSEVSGKAYELAKKKSAVQVEGDRSSFGTEDVLKVWRNQEDRLKDIYIDFDFVETKKNESGSVIANKHENITYMAKENLFRTRKQVLVNNEVAKDWEFSADGTREYYYNRTGSDGTVKNSLPEQAGIKHSWAVHYLSCVERNPRKKGNLGYECNLIGALEEDKRIKVTEELFERRNAVVLNRPDYCKIYLDPTLNFAVLGSEATGSDLTFKCKNSNFVEVADGLWLPLQTERTFKEGSDSINRKIKVNELKVNNNYTKEDFRIKFEPGITVRDIDLDSDVQVEGEDVQDLQKRKKSAKKLSELRILLFIYTNDHEGKYPAKLEEIQQQPYSPADLKSWALENIEYIGSGKTALMSPQSPIAYDQSLLQTDMGTNVLFNSGRVEFVRASQLEELGITVKTEEDGEFVKDETHEARKETQFFILRIIDVNGNPVEGVGVHKYFSIREDGWQSHGRYISDDEGSVKFQKEDIYEYPHEKDGILLYAVSENKLAGFLEITPQHIGKPIQWQLKSACKVYGELESSALEKLNRQLEWTNVYLYSNKYRPLSCSSKTGKFEFILPPGRYRLNAYGISTYSSDQEIEIEAGQRELEVNFDLPADKLATLMGKSAPELREIKGWLNSKPLKLNDLRGKVVLLDFWGYWCGPCIAGIPKLVELHEEFSKDGLTIIAIHDDSLNSTQELSEKLKEISVERWGGKSIPFPIALDGGGMREIKETDKSAKGATTAAYGIQAWPTCVLIDRSGNVVKKFHPSNPDSMNELEKTLGVKSGRIISRSESLRILMSLGRAVLMYANDNQGNFPDSVEQLKKYVSEQKDWQWLNQNIVYLGRGKTATSRPDEILAYDKPSLEKDNSYGTNVLFNDAHVEFKEVGWLKKQGIEISEGKSFQLKSDWRQKFDEVYCLDDGQILKRIAPPFIPERLEFYNHEVSHQAAVIPEPPDYFSFHWEDSKIKRWGLGFTHGKRLLDSILRNNLSIQANKFDGPEELLQIEVPGDWIIRMPSTIEERLKSLEKILSEEIDREIRFEKREVELEVVVATGDFKFHPPTKTYEHDSVHLFTDELDPDERAGGGTADSVNYFLGKLGGLIDMTIVDETTPSEEIKIPYRHHRSSYLRKVKDEHEKKRKLDMLLTNLTKQTELQFRIEHRPVEVWFVTEHNRVK
jgi:thiol-disulfide isomerase/thioredoxin